MPDIERFGMPMKPRLELGAVVRLKREDPEWEAFADLVQEADRRALIAGVVDLENAYTRAVVNRGELIQPFPRSWDALKELHVHLQAVPRLGFLVAFPALTVRLVLLIGWQPAHAVLDQDPVHS